MTGADLAGVRLLSTLDELFTGSGLGGRGWVSGNEQGKGAVQNWWRRRVHAVTMPPTLKPRGFGYREQSHATRAH